MLKAFRNKNMTRLVLWAILILILPAFILWGTGNTGRSERGRASFVGRIDGRKVSFKDFAESLSGVRCQILMNYFDQPAVLNALTASKAFTGRLAWGRLLMLNEAKKRRIKVPDSEVIAYIRSHPIFTRSGQFDDRIYGYILRHNIGVEPRSFEEIVRQNLEIKKLNDLQTADMTISEEEVAESYRKDNGRFGIAYILFPSDDFVEKAGISDGDLRSYYDSHKNDFMLPQKNDGGVSEGSRAATFDDVKENIRTLLSLPKSRAFAFEAASESHKRLEDLMKSERLTFEDSAGKLGLKTRQSGLFSRSEYLEGIGDASGIVEAAVAMRVGDVSKPVETPKGSVIFTLLEVRDYDAGKFEKERDAYRARALETKKMRRLEEILRGLEDANSVNIDFAEYESYYR